MDATVAPMIELDEAECWSLLHQHDLGRLAVSVGREPDIFPINYAVDAEPAQQAIVFRTAPGTKLMAAVLGRSVAFEIDGWERASGEAWSVVVKGVAVQLERVHDIVHAEALPLFPWHHSYKPDFVRIDPTEVTGRRFVASRH
jgi:uncharacterized protein